MTVPVVAVRVCKARYESTCPCGAPIRPGQLIAKCSGGLWQHAACYLGHKHQLDNTPAKGTPA